jgi:AIPR protein
MPDNAVVLLDALLADRAKAGDSISTPPADEAFELFSFEQCLKDQDLSDDEIAAGQVGGGNDGGIDGLYTFLNGNLVEEDAEMLDEVFDPSSVRRESELHVVVIQAKQPASFGETPFDKLAAALRDLLDLAKSEDDLLELFSPTLVDRFEIFRKTWQKLATRHPRIRVTVFYATKGESTSINAKVHTKGDRLCDQIRSGIPKAEAQVFFKGARDLVELAGQEKSYTLQVSFRENATAEDSHIALVSLEDYFDFLTDDNGALQKHIFDWNVRDYEGAVEVNREIAGSLGDAASPEFWWLNNGVTVICSRASATGKTFSLDDVQIVNGLQTSVTIFEYLRDAEQADPARSRLLLLRIIVTDDHATRDRVIRATNRQTNVPPASLRATDDIQRDIERFFLSDDWFYERRKNYYRNQSKPSAKIVSIPYLAQAIMAIGLSDPSNSRARPSSLLKRDADYARIFDSRVEYRIYLWVAKVQKQVDQFLRSERAAASTSDRTNLRFHVSMLLVATRLGARVYNPQQLTGLVGIEFTEEEMATALDAVRNALDAFQQEHSGPIDKIVKGRDFTDALLGATFPQAESESPQAP